MQGYCVLACSASRALGRVGKHNLNPPGALEPTAFSSGQWIIYLIFDIPKMSGTQGPILIINHSYKGQEATIGRHLDHWRRNAVYI